MLYSWYEIRRRRRVCWTGRRLPTPHALHHPPDELTRHALGHRRLALRLEGAHQVDRAAHLRAQRHAHQHVRRVDGARGRALRLAPAAHAALDDGA